MNIAKAKILLGYSFILLSVLGRPFSVTSADSAEGKLPPVKLRVGVPSGTVVYSTYFLAKEMGFYRDEGLDVEMIHVTAVTGLQALLAGDLQFVGAGTTPINAAIRGAKLKTVFVAVDKPEFDLYVSPQVRTFAAWVVPTSDTNPWRRELLMGHSCRRPLISRLRGRR